MSLYIKRSYLVCSWCVYSRIHNLVDLVTRAISGGGGGGGLAGGQDYCVCFREGMGNNTGICYKMKNLIFSPSP